jgi:hypothetical protein
MSPHHLAVIISCAIIGALILSAIAMGVFLCYRRRRAIEAATDPGPPSESSSGKGPPSISSECSWCYIAENKVCIWCAGQARDEDYKYDARRGRLYVDTMDLKNSGWRSALSFPAPNRNASPQGNQSHVNAISRKRSQEEKSPGSSITGKRSFKPGGIYEIPTIPLGPAAVCRVNDEIMEIERR